jgi:uncharacterized BrkB/YihY/UPF0761 family membrane protein
MTEQSNPTPTAGERGRGADAPREIPKTGWRDILLRVKENNTQDNLSVVAAGVAFFWFLAIFPALGAAVSLLLWFFLSAYAVLIGAELDAELEHQTRLDSTVGDRQPMGQRGAHVADTVGESP